MRVSKKRNVKELKLKANHNITHHSNTCKENVKELKLKANHNLDGSTESFYTNVKELKLKANHNSHTVAAKARAAM